MKGIYNPRQKSWDTKHVLLSTQLSVLRIRLFFPFLLEKTEKFPTLIRGYGGYLIQLKCSNYVWSGLQFAMTFNLSVFGLIEDYIF